MTIPKEPVAQPDPHEGARKWLAECEWVELIDSRGVDELAALLREREATAERRGATERDAEWSRLLGWAKPRTPEAYAVVLAEAATFTDEVRGKLNRLEAAAERKGAEARDKEFARLLISALAEWHRNAKAMRQHDEAEARARELATLYVEEILLTIRMEAFARAIPLPGDERSSPHAEGREEVKVALASESGRAMFALMQGWPLPEERIAWQRAVEEARAAGKAEGRREGEGTAVARYHRLIQDALALIDPEEHADLTDAMLMALDGCPPACSRPECEEAGREKGRRETIEGEAALHECEPEWRNSGDPGELRCVRCMDEGPDSVWPCAEIRRLRALLPKAPA